METRLGRENSQKQKEKGHQNPGKELHNCGLATRNVSITTDRILQRLDLTYPQISQDLSVPDKTEMRVFK